MSHDHEQHLQAVNEADMRERDQLRDNFLASLTPEQKQVHEENEATNRKLRGLYCMPADVIARLPQFPASMAQAFMQGRYHRGFNPKQLAVLVLTQEHALLPQDLALNAINQSLPPGASASKAVFESIEMRAQTLALLVDAPTVARDIGLAKQLLELGKDALRAVKLYEPSPEAVENRADWMAEMHLLRILTDLKNTGFWDNNLCIEEPFENERRFLQLKENESLSDPHHAVRVIRSVIDTGDLGIAFQWEKQGEAPAPTKLLDAFAKLTQQRIGNDPQAVMPEIEKIVQQIQLQQLSKRIISQLIDGSKNRAQGPVDAQGMRERPRG